MRGVGYVTDHQRSEETSEESGYNDTDCRGGRAQLRRDDIDRRAGDRGGVQGHKQITEKNSGKYKSNMSVYVD